MEIENTSNDAAREGTSMVTERSSEVMKKLAELIDNNLEMFNAGENFKKAVIENKGKPLMVRTSKGTVHPYEEDPAYVGFMKKLEQNTTKVTLPPGIGTKHNTP